MIGDADAALAPFDAATSRTVSAAWRTDPEGFREAATGLRGAMDRLRGRVTLLAPADGTYSLASSDAPLVLTVQNDLPFAVKVLLRDPDAGSRGLAVGRLGAQSLAPGERTTLQVPTEVRQSGGFAVTAELTTPGGQLLGEPRPDAGQEHGVRLDLAAHHLRRGGPARRCSSCAGWSASCCAGAGPRGALPEPAARRRPRPRPPTRSPV